MVLRKDVSSRWGVPVLRGVSMDSGPGEPRWAGGQGPEGFRQFGEGSVVPRLDPSFSKVTPHPLFGGARLGPCGWRGAGMPPTRAVLKAEGTQGWEEIQLSS